MNLILTNHAFERIKERAEKKVFQCIVSEAWYNGKILSTAETRKMFYKGISEYKEDYLLCDFRKYKNLIFIFRRVESTVYLKTVLTEGQLWSKEEFTLPKTIFQKIRSKKKIGYWDFTQPNSKRIKIKI